MEPRSHRPSHRIPHWLEADRGHAAGANEIAERRVRQAFRVGGAYVRVFRVVGAKLLAVVGRMGDDLGDATRQVGNTLHQQRPDRLSPWRRHECVGGDQSGPRDQSARDAREGPFERTAAKPDRQPIARAEAHQHVEMTPVQLKDVRIGLTTQQELAMAFGAASTARTAA
jgi:hypothetical protein